MTAETPGAAAAETRAWQGGEFAWADGRMWFRRSSDWVGLLHTGFRTDADMTAAGAVLVATADGPVSQHLQAEIHARTADYDDLRDNHLIPALNELAETRAALDRQVRARP